MKFFIRRVAVTLFLIAIIVISVVTAMYLPQLSYAETIALQNEKNNPILIIDPGHGGEDGGAVSLTGAKECDINLSIAQKLEQISAFCGVTPVMTRSTNDIHYPETALTTHERKVADQKQRLELINSLQNGTLISIHQNNYTDTQPFGAQVLYAPIPDSDRLAKVTQQILIDNLNPKNYRSASQIAKDIFLLNHISRPGILVECGFLSNPQEEQQLRDVHYQLKLAAAIFSGYASFCTNDAQINIGEKNEN